VSRQLAVALDLGSTSARAVMVDVGGEVVAEARRPTEPLFPQRGWVELDPWHLWRGLRDSLEEALRTARATTDDIAGAGVTTSRETCLVWERATGQPIYPAIMWMSKQTDGIVDRWRAEGLDEEFRARTGLFNDSFFSAAKLGWILETVPGARARAEAGELVAGTLDTWLVWNLTGGRHHATDPSEASRTALFSLADLTWDDVLCRAAGVPPALLPEVRDSDGFFGEARPDELGLPGTAAFPITAVMGDQMAGMFVPGLPDHRVGQEHLRHGRGADREQRPTAGDPRRPHRQRRLDFGRRDRLRGRGRRVPQRPDPAVAAREPRRARP
jgi:glycerol kinase